MLDFGQAQRKVLANAKVSAEEASGKLYTLGDAVTDYAEYLRTHRKSADDAAIKLKAYLSPELQAKRVADLKATDLDQWLTHALKHKAARRGKPKPPKKGKRAAKGKDDTGKLVAADSPEAAKPKTSRTWRRSCGAGSPP